MARNRNAERYADSLCSPTCPAVDKAFWALKEALANIAPEDADLIKRELDSACEAVKDQGTLLLRSALVGACEDIQALEGERDDLLQQVTALEREIESLNDEIASMAKEEA